MLEVRIHHLLDRTTAVQIKAGTVQLKTGKLRVGT